MRGIKTGGRQPGTPNKKSQEIRELIAQRYPDYNPLLALTEIATNPENEVGIRYQANKEVAKYLYPQLKSVEVKETQEPVEVMIIRVQDEETKKAIEKI